MNFPTIKLLLARALLVGSIVLAAPLCAAADYRSSWATSSDGTKLSVREWGNPQGLELLFIHGGIQSQLSFKKQTEAGMLARDFRIVTFDMRGHGESDKPASIDGYSSAQFWADDVKAVIEATGLKRPVIVAWSAGGRVALQYVLSYGDKRLAGINLVDASDPRYFGDSAKSLIPLMAGNSLESVIAYTDAFISACFAAPPSAPDRLYMVAFNMVVPPVARRGMASWKLDVDQALASISVPTLITHGKLDGIIKVDASEYYATRIKTSTLSIYEGAGHSPFWENPDRFNSELAHFVRDANERR